METYIAILRGINVSGHNLVKMDVLRSVFVDSGFVNVQTYIQSGNIIFQANPTYPADLEKKIARIVFEKFDFDVPVIVLELKELKRIIESNPFPADKSKDVKFMHITFLSETPAKESIDKILSGQYGRDEFVLISKNIYLYCPDGYGKTKLTNTFFENKLKISATTRNLKTSDELLRMAEKLKST